MNKYVSKHQWNFICKEACWFKTAKSIKLPQDLISQIDSNFGKINKAIQAYHTGFLTGNTEVCKMDFIDPYTGENKIIPIVITPSIKKIVGWDKRADACYDRSRGDYGTIFLDIGIVFSGNLYSTICHEFVHAIDPKLNKLNPGKRDFDRPFEMRPWEIDAYIGGLFSDLNRIFSGMIRDNKTDKLNMAKLELYNWLRSGSKVQPFIFQNMDPDVFKIYMENPKLNKRFRQRLYDFLNDL